ncbi:MAG TPA: hypothetical protein VFN33_00605 [Gaiellaceae bacterium]|nr:hypothetical protein [Gaiellaceae bacterium]
MLDRLGYGCATAAGTEKHRAEYPLECRTAFCLVRGKLSLFFTNADCD